MTGNKNAWRAPLAGLASLAMLATMGVAATTANAADAAGNPELTVKFDVNGGTGSFSDVKANKASSYKVAAPTSAPSRDGYVFTGWYTSAEVGQGERFDFAGTHLADGTETLYAHYAKSADVQQVKFLAASANSTVKLPDNDQNGSPDTPGTTVKVAKADSKLASWQKPADANNADGWIVSGAWKVGSRTGAEYKDGDALPTTGTVSLYAAAEKGHVVTFDTNGSWATSGKLDADLTAAGASAATGVTFVNNAGTSTEGKVEVADGATLPDHVNAFEASTKLEVTDWVYANGKQFSLWQEGSPVTDNLTLHAVKPASTNNKVYQVNFYGDHNTVAYYPNATQTSSHNWLVGTTYVRDGEGVTLPTIDTFGDYYYVSGWTNGSADFNDGDTVSADSNLFFNFAKTARAEYTVTFDANYTGATPTQITVKKGEYVTAPADPVRDGYVFVGWYLTGTGPTAGDPKTQKLNGVVDPSTIEVNGNLNFFAGWLKDTKVAELAKVNKLSNGTIASSAFDFTAASVKAFKTAYAEAQTKANLTVKEDKALAADASLYDVAQFTDEAKAESLTKDLQAAQAKLVAKNQDSVYRVYDVNGSRKHLYTSNSGEAAGLIASGWRNEGVAFKTVHTDEDYVRTTDPAVASGLYEPVFRLYDQPAKRHLYTEDSAEYANLVNNLGWRDEGVAFYARTQGGEAVYRAYSPSRYEHLFTTNQTEYNNATNAKGEGWYRAEGIKFNVE